MSQATLKVDSNGKRAGLSAAMEYLNSVSSGSNAKISKSEALSIYNKVVNNYK
jgi:hypothetical protein